MPGPAYHLRTARLDLLAADPARALDFLRCTEASADALVPWLDFASNLPDEDGIIELMRTWRAMFDRDEDRHYHLVDRATDQIVGACGVHDRVRGNARELGYWVRSDRHGEGLATEAMGAVVRAEMDLTGLDRLDLYIEPGNAASIRVAEKLGFTRQGVLREQIPWSGGPDRDAAIYALFREDWPDHPLGRTEVEAFDVIGRPISLPG